MNNVEKLVLDCVDKYRDLLRVNSEGFAQELDSLTITNLTYAVSEITGLDFFELVENIPFDDLQSVTSFQRSVTKLIQSQTSDSTSP